MLSFVGGFAVGLLLGAAAVIALIAVYLFRLHDRFAPWRRWGMDLLPGQSISSIGPTTSPVLSPMPKTPTSPIDIFPGGRTAHPVSLAEELAELGRRAESALWLNVLVDRVGRELCQGTRVEALQAQLVRDLNSVKKPEFVGPLVIDCLDLGSSFPRITAISITESPSDLLSTSPNPSRRSSSDETGKDGEQLSVPKSSSRRGPLGLISSPLRLRRKSKSSPIPPLRHPDSPPVPDLALPTEGGGSDQSGSDKQRDDLVELEVGLVYTGGLTLSISTELWMNWPVDALASLSVSLTASIQQIEGRLRIRVPGTEEGKFTAAVQWVEEPIVVVDIKSSLGHGDRLKNLAGLTRFIQDTISKVIANEMCDPAFINIPLEPSKKASSTDPNRLSDADLLEAIRNGRHGKSPKPSPRRHKTDQGDKEHDDDSTEDAAEPKEPTSMSRSGSGGIKSLFSRSKKNSSRSSTASLASAASSTSVTSSPELEPDHQEHHSHSTPASRDPSPTGLRRRKTPKIAIERHVYTDSKGKEHKGLPHIHIHTTDEVSTPKGSKFPVTLEAGLRRSRSCEPPLNRGDSGGSVTGSGRSSEDSGPHSGHSTSDGEAEHDGDGDGDGKENVKKSSRRGLFSRIFKTKKRSKSKSRSESHGTEEGDEEHKKDQHASSGHGSGSEDVVPDGSLEDGDSEGLSSAAGLDSSTKTSSRASLSSIASATSMVSTTSTASVLTETSDFDLDAIKI